MFDLDRNNGGNPVNDTVFLAKTASTAYHYGEALVLSSGKAIAASGAVKPLYVSLSEIGATDADPLIAMPITDDMEFAVPFSATPTSIVAGDLVTIDSTGMKITATKSSGVARIQDMCGATAAGDIAIVRF